MTPSPKVAIIGCGHWGKNLVRNFYTLEALSTICDLDADRVQKLRKQYPGIKATTHYEADILADPAITGVVISTPSTSHFVLAKAALLAGKHVYVEKPLATSVVDTQELYTIAQHEEKLLMVGHLLMYHPAVNRLKQLIEEGYLGTIRYIESDRLNMNPFRSDKSVFWDLAPHDLSMMMFLIGQDPSHVISVEGSKTSNDGLIDVAHIEFEFQDGVRGHIHNSWVHPVKQVKLVVRGTERTAIIDDTLVGSEKLQVFSHKSPPERVLPEYLSLEPLKLECQHFLHCMETNRQPNSDGVNGLKVVQILEEAEQKMAASGLVSAPI